MNRILVIDDDIELCELLSDYLGSEGFAVETVNHGEQGAEQALAGEYVLVVLDVMLPGMNGFDVLRKIRESSKLPVIMLTARGDDIDRIVGLELGADDYLPKPFNPRELVARVRAIQRRTEVMASAQAGAAQYSSEVSVGDVMRTDFAVARLLEAGGIDREACGDERFVYLVDSEEILQGWLDCHDLDAGHSLADAVTEIDWRGARTGL